VQQSSVTHPHLASGVKEILVENWHSHFQNPLSSSTYPKFHSQERQMGVPQFQRIFYRRFKLQASSLKSCANPPNLTTLDLGRIAFFPVTSIIACPSFRGYCFRQMVKEAISVIEVSSTTTAHHSFKSETWPHEAFQSLNVYHPCPFIHVHTLSSHVHVHI